MTHINDAELLDPAPDLRVHNAWGTVGWAGDPDVLDGLGKDEEDGVTLVKVTLFRGSPQGKPEAEDGAANGYQVRVQPSGPGWRIPPKGTRVMVSFADGDIRTPGNGLIIGEVGTSPRKQFGRKKVILDYGDADVVITGKSVTLLADGNPEGKSDKGKRHLVSVSANGGAQMASGGCGVFVMGKDDKGKWVGSVQLKAIDEDGMLCTSGVFGQSAIGLMNSSPTAPTKGTAVNLKNGNVTITGVSCVVQTGSVMLGALATAATPAQQGPIPANGAPSTSVFVAP